MGVAFDNGSEVVSAGQTLSLSTLLSVSASGSDPTYLVLDGFDRNEYTVGASGATGSFTGNAHALGFASVGGDGRGAGIVFTYQSSTGRYYNSRYGFLDQLTYTASTSSGDVTDLSLFGSNNMQQANANASDALSLAEHDGAGYLGTLTVATVPNWSGAVPVQATPLSIAATADGFVGQAWNMDGCWVLASTIAAEAGASLPVQSTADMAGVANGEWFVAFNGPAGSTGNWESEVRTGDVIGFITSSGSGHITTCVSGLGTSAMLVDNITYGDAEGNVVNAADDGSSDDIIVSAPHPAAEEWTGVAASSVVIFRLDTPVVTTTTLRLAPGSSQTLANAVSASDPEAKSITEYQLYTATGADGFTVGGKFVVADTASSAVTVGSLSQISFDLGADGAPDTISVRAYNGSYWGDWTSTTAEASTIVSPATTIPASTSATPTTASATSPTPSSVITAATTQAPVSQAPISQAPISQAPVSQAPVSLYRFFDTIDGTHFFTASTSERDALLATRPDFKYEGVGLEGFASPSPTGEAIYRFFDIANGTHFYTANAAESTSLRTSGSDLTFEGIAFYEDAAPQTGDLAVYRFFDSNNGTHLYTESASERAAILATRPDLKAEGIAFYAPA